MLTKEFATKVGLSEKQVRKIVQHLEDRGYQLSKTEYRGREATDFQEEDIELFQEIAEKVKETNSYDQAFETLEKEKDFLQVLVKDTPTQQTPELQQLIDELRVEVQHMRRERQMLGEMLQQVHIQQQKLEQTLALQEPKEDVKQEDTHKTEPKSTSQENVTATTTQQIKADSIDENPSKVTVETKEEVKPTAESNATTKDEANKEEAVSDNKENKVSQSSVETTDKKEVKSEESSTSSESTSNSTSEDPNKEEPSKPSTETSEPSTSEQEEEPKKKGFFQRLFNI
ncbi:hypothetical protein [Mammaliicoccus stepanovicii]|uniref:Putative DNA-binding protein n=1 Tax=Mammaliicoccus stepanovicii TaxID=643214 RepID=A0A240AF17_9STAP|nr:hypothetical protein [Mammaliicoccus stepanovicii]PNZ77747.1 hypothetical protein CD111_03740 [Mammaliicoccus stepanovicii]GGI42825.1 hypothetical protein GCM10010896_20340 [Mammaliicoccus stepanovicii]SNV81684.1 putative DNA-binding protein [Mammaliicoccus stepanovicii]